MSDYDKPSRQRRQKKTWKSRPPKKTKARRLAGVAGFQNGVEVGTSGVDSCMGWRS